MGEIRRGLRLQIGKPKKRLGILQWGNLYPGEEGVEVHKRLQYQKGKKLVHIEDVRQIK